MTAVTQLLPNFIQGINEQPDELKKPGQVRDAVNVYPDITKGLLKRTGYKVTASLLDNSPPFPPAEGTWFHVMRRDGIEKKKYVFNVSTTGFVRGWDADTGVVQTIGYSNDAVDLGAGDEVFDSLEIVGMQEIDYLNSDSAYAIKTATLADTTFLCNSNKVTSMSGAAIEKRPYESFIEFKVVDTSRAYTINFDNVGNDNNVSTQVSKFKITKTNGFVGKTEDFSSCPAVGTYNLSTNKATNDKYNDGNNNDNGKRAGEIIVKVTISAQPRILSLSKNYSCNYYVSDAVLLSGGSGWQKGDRFKLELPEKYGDEKKALIIECKVQEIVTTTSQVDVNNISVTPNAGDNSLLSLQNLLADEIIDRVTRFSEDNIKIVGNGIYISDNKPFKIDTPETDLLNILTGQSEFDPDWESKREAYRAEKEAEDASWNEDDDPNFLKKRFKYPNPYAVVTNVSNLPLECKPGFVAKVANSFSEDDDYYVQFIRESGDVVTDGRYPDPTNVVVSGKFYKITTTDGTYAWNIVTAESLTTATPVGTIFLSNATDTLSAGNTVTEIPRYTESGTGYWKEVAKPGERSIINSSSLPHALRYRANTADWVVASIDYADRTCGTEEKFTPSFVGHKINNILFYRNRLVLLSGSSVVTSTAGDFTNFFPSTALTVSPSDPVDVEATSDYTANLYASIQINNALLVLGEHNQFLLTTDADIFSPMTAKLSQVSSYKFDTNSEPFIIATNVGFVGNTDSFSSMYEMTNIFREGQTDIIEKSKLISSSFAAEYSMTSSSKDTGLITFGKKGSEIIWLYKYFKENSQSDIQQAWFKWELPAAVSYQFLADNYHYVVSENGKLYKNDLESSLYQDDDVDYEMKIVLPTFYVVKNEQKSFLADTAASLVIHRMHLNTGESNCYTVNIDRFGKDSYEIKYEQSIQDAYKAGSSPVTFNREQTIPLYEKSTNLDISITSTANGPFTLYSLRWEGDYNNRYYQRV